jgi:hypothetical protein
MGRLEDESEEAKAVDFLARTVHEPIEYIETDRVDTEGNKIDEEHAGADRLHNFQVLKGLQ